MALCKLTLIKKTDGTTREVTQVFYEGDYLEPVVLEPGEEIVETLQASTTLVKFRDGIQDPVPEELIVELRAIREAIKFSDLVDITNKIQ